MIVSEGERDLLLALSCLGSGWPGPAPSPDCLIFGAVCRQRTLDVIVPRRSCVGLEPAWTLGCVGLFGCGALGLHGALGFARGWRACLAKPDPLRRPARIPPARRPGLVHIAVVEAVTRVHSVPQGMPGLPAPATRSAVAVAGLMVGTPRGCGHRGLVPALGLAPGLCAGLHSGPVLRSPSRAPGSRPGSPAPGRTGVIKGRG